MPGKTKPPALQCGFQVKARAGIADREMNLTRRSPQAHFEALCPAMLRRVVQGLLQDAKKAKGNL